jgi:gluconokinase
MNLTTTFPKSGHDSVGGLVFFRRMLDKIRLHASGQLPDDYNLGNGLDARMCRFLNVDYDAVAKKASEEKDDAVVLEWCFAHGRRPSDDDILYFNGYMTKRGWRDESSEKIKASKAKHGWSDRDDIQTTFDLQDLGEGRKQNA